MSVDRFGVQAACLGCREGPIRGAAHDRAAQPAFRRCERSDAIQRRDKDSGLLRRFAPRNDGVETRKIYLAAHGASEFCEALALGKTEGAGKAGHRLMPVAPVREKSTGQEPQVQPECSGPPCANGLRLIRDLPGAPGLLATISARSESFVASATTRLRALRGTPASGCQDHAISPSASQPFVLRQQRVHRIPRSTSVTTRTPLAARRDGRRIHDF